MMRLIGECAQKCQMDRYFQSVPGLKHREISVMTLARRVIDAGDEWLNRLRPKETIPLRILGSDSHFCYFCPAVWSFLGLPGGRGAARR
jgi:hypothetical protein